MFILQQTVCLDGLSISNRLSLASTFSLNSQTSSETLLIAFSLFLNYFIARNYLYKFRLRFFILASFFIIGKDWQSIPYNTNVFNFLCWFHSCSSSIFFKNIVRQLRNPQKYLINLSFKKLSFLSWGIFVQKLNEFSEFILIF